MHFRLCDGCIQGMWFRRSMKAKIRNRFTRELIREVDVPLRSDGFGRYLASLMELDYEEENIPADFGRCDLSDCDLSEADLRDVDLLATNLVRAVLNNADLEDAYLVNADLTGASLVNASLKNAGLHGTTLRGADLTGVDLTGAKYNAATIWPDNFDPASRGATFIDMEKFKRDMEKSRAT